jgi:hypothetical protein
MLKRTSARIERDTADDARSRKSKNTMFRAADDRFAAEGRLRVRPEN